MCELMSIAAAIVFTAVFLIRRRNGADASAERTVALAFWGASLMWAVDCVHALVAEGELLDLSADDARLGAVVVAAGLVAYAALRIRRRISSHA